MSRLHAFPEHSSKLLFATLFGIHHKAYDRLRSIIATLEKGSPTCNAPPAPTFTVSPLVTFRSSTGRPLFSSQLYEYPSYVTPEIASLPFAIRRRTPTLWPPYVLGTLMLYVTVGRGPVLPGAPEESV